MDFDPINQDHAIEAVSFSLFLEKPLDEAAIDAVRQYSKAWRSELPAIQTPQSFRILMTGGTPVTKPGTAIEFAYLRPDGSPAWVLRFTGPELTVECSRYTRWAQVWGTAQKYLMDALRAVGSTGYEHKILSASLTVTDKFRAKKESYDLHTLFSKSRYIPCGAFEFGPTWHSHTGWFDHQHDQPILHNLNIDARREEYSDHETGEPRSGLFVSLSHLQQCRHEPAVKASVYGEEGSNLLSSNMERMHQDGKKVVSALLTPEMKLRIGLE